jgi:hypothetical protein
MRLLPAGIIIGLVLALLACSRSHGRDLGQWDETDLVTRHWYQTLMQPDNPAMSCCGEADGYWCDIIKTDTAGGEVHVYCTITDDRDDAPLKRPHIAVGTDVEIPPNKLKWDRGNPTGHAVVFLSRQLYVYCFVQGTGG